MKIFVIADTHFYHKNIIAFENRPNDHVEQIIANWNKLVGADDLVIHLGDVIFGENKDTALLEVMKRLTGKKVLCRGNHDKYPESKWGEWDWFMERGFDFVCDYFVYDKYAFSHCPLTPLPNQANRSWEQPVELNIHGHFHRNIPNGEDFVLPTGDKRTFNNELYNWDYYKENKDKYKLVQIEDELRPFTLEELLTKNSQ